MRIDEILQSITVQGTLLDLDTGLYRRILAKEEKHRAPNEFVWVVTEVVNKCESGQMDPWDIDLIALTKLFANSMNETSPNFSLAGRFIAESWKFLFEKSRDLLIKQDDIQEDAEVETAEEIIAGIEALVQVKPRIYHQEKRKIMLLEVLESMRSLYQRPSYTKQAQSIKEEIPESSIEEIIVELNAEEPEVEKMKILQLMADFGSSMLMDEVWGFSKGEKSSFFQYSLFLAKEKRIALHQNEPYGQIRIDILDG
jgi:chromatin segregation and condensation protein Rec8/ScpA/Scc1 (kleisin family)